MSGAEPREEKPGVGEALRTGLGVLAALRDAVEETVQEAVERGDLHPERARRAVHDAMRRAGDALGEVRERLEAAPSAEVAQLRAEVAELRRRIEVLEGGGGPRRALPPAVSEGGEGGG